jgi:hypothetical protein
MIKLGTYLISYDSHPLQNGEVFIQMLPHRFLPFLKQKANYGALNKSLF